MKTGLKIAVGFFAGLAMGAGLTKAFTQGSVDAASEQHYAGILAARNDVLQQMENIESERQTRMLRFRLERSGDDRSHEWAWMTLSNLVAYRIDGPVQLAGHVSAKWPEGMMVQGLSYGTWPKLKDGIAVQPGGFVVRNCKTLKPADQIRGVGTDPLPVVFTNRFGEIRLVWSYNLEPQHVRK